MTIVDGHPDPAREHLNHALADRYAAAAGEAGHVVRRIDVGELDFPLLRVPSDFYERTPPPAIERAQDDLRRADHIVFFFPLWDGDMPAVLKGFIEQTFRPGFALEYGAGPLGLPKRLLTGKSARIVVTMGMPAMFYRTVFRAHAVKAFEAMLRFNGVSPVRVTLLGNVLPNARADGSCRMKRMDALARRDGRLRSGRGLLRRLARVSVLAGACYATIRLLRSP